VTAVLHDAHHAPLVGDDRGGETEGHHVGKAVVLLAEGALGVRQARDAPIEGVEDHRREHRHAGVIEVLVDRSHHRVKAREQAAGGEQVRQQVDAFAARPERFRKLVCHVRHLIRGLLLRCQLPCDC